MNSEITTFVIRIAMRRRMPGDLCIICGSSAFVPGDLVERSLWVFGVYIATVWADKYQLGYSVDPTLV